MPFFQDSQPDPHGERAGKYRTGPDGIFPVWPCILLPYLPHLLADDPADGVGGVLFHLGRGVGVGVQREPCRVVAQRAGQRFHVYPAFQGQRGEGVSEIMEPNVLRADGFQNFVMGSPEGVRVIHGSGFGRWEQIRIARVLFVFGNQQVDRLLRKGQRSHGVASFRRTDHQFPVDAVQTDDSV